MDGRHAGLLMNINRQTTALVIHLNRTILMDGDGYFVAVTVDGFIDGIIDDFPNQVMKARAVC